MKFLHFLRHDYVPVSTDFKGNDTLITSVCECNRQYKYTIRDAHLTLKDITE